MEKPDTRNIGITELLSIFDNMNVGTIITDRQGVVLWGNRYYSETAKFDIQDYFGRNIREISGYESVIPGKEKMIDIVLRIKGMHREIVKYNTDDYVVTTAIPVLSEEGEIAYILYTIMNYSDTIKMERELAYSHSKAAALETQLMQEQFDRLRSLDIIAETKEMRRIFQMGVRVASSHVSVMILGESGVGKDVLAKFIHVNLGAIPPFAFRIAAIRLSGYLPDATTYYI